MTPSPPPSPRTPVSTTASSFLSFSPDGPSTPAGPPRSPARSWCKETPRASIPSTKVPSRFANKAKERASSVRLEKPPLPRKLRSESPDTSDAEDVFSDASYATALSVSSFGSRNPFAAILASQASSPPSSASSSLHSSCGVGSSLAPSPFPPSDDGHVAFDGRRASSGLLDDDTGSAWEDEIYSGLSSDNDDGRGGDLFAPGWSRSRTASKSLPAINTEELDRFFGTRPASKQEKQRGLVSEEDQLAQDALRSDDLESGQALLGISSSSGGVSGDEADCSSADGRRRPSAVSLHRRNRPPPLRLTDSNSSRSRSASVSSSVWSADYANSEGILDGDDDAGASCLEAEIERGEAIRVVEHACVATPVLRHAMTQQPESVEQEPAKPAVSTRTVRTKRSVAQRLRGFCGDLFSAQDRRAVVA
ncbi:hypothetical protein JCM10908_000010 [Rhodotorula pacifica]|uniref:uncharacterized protein n=1 Tax=Rhodotorula pacifica TaxID=1495444 RepID=UPI00316B0BF5